MTSQAFRLSRTAELWAELRRWLTGRVVEPVELRARRFNYLPQRFRWRGHIHSVARVERVWERAGSGRRAPRRYFEVCCHDQVLTLFQDLHCGTWFVEL